MILGVIFGAERTALGHCFYSFTKSLYNKQLGNEGASASLPKWVSLWSILKNVHFKF